MWKHVPDNAVAWEYFKNGLLYHGSELGGMIQYPDPYAWGREEWMQTCFDGNIFRKNYIQLED
jgi:hypothetical protein